jgi:NodT family efflux transporter outer membrane factor (OMF) lipoprotein
MLMSVSKLSFYPLVLFLSLFLASCAIPEPQLVKENSLELSTIEQIVDEHSKPIDTKWWHVFGDDQLNSLVDMGLKNSPSLQVANQRVKLAEALLNSSRSILLPQVGITGQANRQQLSQNYIFVPGVMDRIANYGFIAGTFSWSLDLWGKNQKLFEASSYRMQAAILEDELTRLNLQIAIVAAYVEYDAAIKNKILNQRMVSVAEELLAIYTIRQKSGLVDALIVSQTKADLQRASAQLAMVQSSVEMYANQIAILTGHPPSWVNQITVPTLKFSPTYENTYQKIPSDLIARRVDLQILLKQIKASSKEYSAAQLDYLPSFDLQANIGYQSFGLDRLINSSSQLFSIGPVLNLPIFNGGRIDANVAAKKATVESVIASYHETLLQALKESADGINRVKSLSQQLQSQVKATKEAEFVYEQLLARKNSGLISSEQLLQNERNVIIQRQLLEQTKLDTQAAYLSLINALGGGFLVPTENSSQTPTNRI